MKNKLLALLFGVFGVVVLVGGLYYALSYLGYIGNLLISFFSANSVDSITTCGLFVPQGFNEIRDQIATSILPMLYLGLPITLLAISVLMFLSGFFYGKHTMETAAETHKQREEHIQREVERRVGGRPAEEEEKPGAKGKPLSRK
ncbi:MAG: hypothetical protein PHQ80_03940 [Candidatus ainarchaeum sp.]|nr:hypothetical protein [Candidatus ainarchaeum sp.]MDD5096434.1 hypothetical protein [Candidatus ainarchaeum sp.]